MTRTALAKGPPAWCGAAALACLVACMGGIGGLGLDSGMGDSFVPKATIRLVSMSVPPGSTLAVRTLALGAGAPQSEIQQVPDLRATVGITSDTDVLGAAIQVFVATSKTHCIASP